MDHGVGVRAALGSGGRHWLRIDREAVSVIASPTSETTPGGWPPCAVYAAATRRVAPSTRLGAASESELFVDERKAAIVDDVKLPSAATRAIRAYATLRKKADEEDRRAARAARRAVRVLRTGKLKMSARNAARLPGLSHQRVHQLT